MLKFIAGVKGAIQVMGYELELGVSRVCHAHVLLTHVAPTWATTRATPRPHSHLVSMVTGETEF
jgi:hypothetical protein